MRGGWGLGGCRGGGLGGWSAKTGWGAVDDLVNLACAICRLRAGERRELAAHLLPEHAVGSGLSPDGEAGRLATLNQCLLQGAPPCHQRRPCWPGVRSEACKQLTWKPVHGHARHVGRPAEQTATVVLFHSSDSETSVRLHRGDAATSGMLHGDPTHGTAAPVMEAAKLGEEIFTEASHLTAVEQNRQHEDRINLARRLTHLRAMP